MSSRTNRAFKSPACHAGRRAHYFLRYFAAPAIAQQRALTTADYERAEKFMGYNTTPLAFSNSVAPNWLPDERFTYRVITS